MTSLHLNTIDPAELMPTPEIPESFGPRNEEERRVYNLVKEALDSGPGKSYCSVAEFIADLRTTIRRTAA